MPRWLRRGILFVAHEEKEEKAMNHYPEISCDDT